MSRIRSVEGKSKVHPRESGGLPAPHDAKRAMLAHSTPGSIVDTPACTGPPESPAASAALAVPPTVPDVAFGSAVRKAATARRWIRVRNDLQANGLLISLTARGSYRARLLFATCAAACAITLGALLTDAAEARETSETDPKGTTSATVVRLVENSPSVTYTEARRAGEIAAAQTENSKGVGRYLKELARGGATPRIEAHNAYLAGMGGEELAAAYADDAKDKLKDKDKNAKDETGGELAAEPSDKQQAKSPVKSSAKPGSADKTQDGNNPQKGKGPKNGGPEPVPAGSPDGAPEGVPEGELAMAKFEPSAVGAPGGAADTRPGDPKREPADTTQGFLRDSPEGPPKGQQEPSPETKEPVEPASGGPDTQEAFAEYVATGDDTALEGAVEREIGQTTETPPEETPTDLPPGDTQEVEPQDADSQEGDSQEEDTEVAYAPETDQNSGPPDSTDSSEPYTAQNPEAAPQEPAPAEPAPIPQTDTETASEPVPETGGTPLEPANINSGYDDPGYEDSDSMSDTEQAYGEYLQTGDDTELTNVIDGEISGEIPADTDEDQNQALPEDEEAAQEDQWQDTGGEEQPIEPVDQEIEQAPIEPAEPPAPDDYTPDAQEPLPQDTGPDVGAPPTEEGIQQTSQGPEGAEPVTQTPAQPPGDEVPEEESPKKDPKTVDPAVREEDLGPNMPYGQQDEGPQDGPPDDVPEPHPDLDTVPAPTPGPSPVPVPEPAPAPIAEPVPTPAPAPEAPAANSVDQNSVQQITQIQTGGIATNGEEYASGNTSGIDVGTAESVLDPAYAGDSVPDPVTGYYGTGGDPGAIDAALGTEITSQVNEQVADQVSSVVPDATYYQDGSYGSDLAAPAEVPARAPAAGVEAAGEVDPYVADPYSASVGGYDQVASVTQDASSLVQESSGVDASAQNSTYVDPYVDPYVEPAASYNQAYVPPAAEVEVPAVTESSSVQTYSTPAPAPAPASAPEPVVQQSFRAESPVTAESPVPADPVQQPVVQETAAPTEAAPTEAAPAQTAQNIVSKALDK